MLPMRAVIDFKGRIAELTDLIAERPADTQTKAGQPPESAVVAEIVARSVADIRSRPDVPADEFTVSSGPDGWEIEQWRSHVVRGRDLARQRVVVRRELGLLAL
ncbi:hypothetical protein ACFVFS_24140 [Kitasatospora sp. NPDC057692]|uniref:hypothetical protein n=1 Tax=Kitasatospora sp. NPDC057692 TaxID=3346215 RepID=UPI0036C18B1E